MEIDSYEQSAYFMHMWAIVVALSFAALPMLCPSWLVKPFLGRWMSSISSVDITQCNGVWGGIRLVEVCDCSKAFTVPVQYKCVTPSHAFQGSFVNCDTCNCLLRMTHYDVRIVYDKCLIELWLWLYKNKVCTIGLVHAVSFYNQPSFSRS